ncbi:hypothetical protein COW99_05050 [Candidatus Roizmanbacteria bacterium CG22_combo_CG10-13_8_21_14_all_38_20]|uniref:Uncharacterized protein n=1 Tax=Candidatus Roizmanbacteria bacterium CG22_combo_CG10-13_8_21_14_all_38_20 TaxID=1974862 RepID=A0A2H0BUQ2_9BACT|nr:hypothetical protein [Candidatus Microgenomates bacterium]PIP61269.1 MAG: hypothetical protein COW99_05050 [Candidatus Roizmanbacteria bacterium CG22_combo_CG10-13_8_21_14_all_38_20]PJC31745.1 MAG: hypothetical protein CO050_02330 [Candidatus Roizmanbacteria bacterium CG_4_9_14_0_2_um_filter_38_17]
MSSFIGNAVTPPSAPILDGGFAGLASFLIRMITILAGLFSIWNFIVAGFFFMSAGNDPEALSKAWGSIWKSLIGLLLIVSSFVIAAFIGWIFLGSPTAIIAPDFTPDELPQVSLMPTATPAPTHVPAPTNTPTPTQVIGWSVSSATQYIFNPDPNGKIDFVITGPLGQTISWVAYDQPYNAATGATVCGQVMIDSIGKTVSFPFSQLNLPSTGNKYYNFEIYPSEVVIGGCQITDVSRYYFGFIFNISK